MKKLVVVMASCLFLSDLWAAETHYIVPAGTSGNAPASPYTSWETAANDLATVMGAVAAGDTILIAPGTYFPTQQVNLPVANLTIRSCGADGKPDRANTIIDGSKMEDGNDNFISIENWVDRQRIEGLTFCNRTNGRAIGISWVNACQIVDCAFTNNVAPGLAGGAISSYVQLQDGLISNCLFRANKAGVDGGGAITSQQNSESESDRLIVVDCQFEGNEAGVAEGVWVAGGAVRSERCMVLARCSFKDNKCVAPSSAVSSGGQVSVGCYSMVEDCVFLGESGAMYGGVLTLRGVSCKVRNCRFEDLTIEASCYYGVMDVAAEGSVVDSCVVRNVSTANADRDFCFVECPNVTVRNTLVAGGNLGTAFYPFSEQSELRLENVTVAGMQSSHVFYDTPKITWVNSICTGAFDTRCVAGVTNCFLTSDPGVAEKSGVIVGGYPEFVAPSRGDYRLRSTSPCIDKGVELAWHGDAKDVLGRNRVVGSAVDIGACERQPGDEDYHVVRVVATDAEKTGVWKDAIVGIQAAVDAAPEDSCVAIRSGTYAISKPISIFGKSIVLQGRNADSDAIDPEGTILDGGKTVRIMQVTNLDKPVFEQDDGDGVVNARVVIEGLTFKDGNAVDGNGGGLWLRGRSKGTGFDCSRVKNCRFVGNCAASGGGLYLNWGGMAEDCVFECNEATAGGGGGLCEFNHSGKWGDWGRDAGIFDPAAVRCRFVSNKSSLGGGGLSDGSGRGWFRTFARACTFDRNEAGGNGGNAITGNGAVFEDCVFKNGVTTGGWGDNVMIGEQTTLRRCSLVGGRDGVNASLACDAYQRDAPLVCDCVISNGVNLLFTQNSITFRNTLFADASRIYLFHNKTTVRFENCTLAGLDVDIGSGHRECENTKVEAVNTILGGEVKCYGRYDESYAQYFNAENCCFAKMPVADDYITISDSFEGRPHYRSERQGDYSIRHSSPCRDKAKLLDWMTESATDLAGCPRVVTEGKPLSEMPSALPDIGAFENGEIGKGLAVLVK